MISMKNYIDFTDGGFLGYFDECQNQALLDRVIAVARNADGEEINLTDACYLAGIDPESLTPADVKYIVDHFEEEE